MAQAKNQQNNADVIHRQNFIDDLRNEIIEKAEDENKEFHTAATRVLLSWLGYEEKDITFIDSKDSGIDAWKITDTGLEIFQIKTHDLTHDELMCLDPFDNEGVNDLGRVKKLLCFSGINKTVTNSVNNLLGRWLYILEQRKAQEVQKSILVTLNLVILGDRLTPQADEELKRLKEEVKNPIKIKDVDVKFDAVLYTTDSIIRKHWLEDNCEWKDIQGAKKTSIILTPIKEGQWMTDNKNGIFYCLAVDLVKAYQSLGYQLFEPNVRAEIRKSRVNEAIRESIRHRRTRQDFRFLNNGVTITCESFDPPKKGGRKNFVAHYPGVVNGLQTVVALENASMELSEKDFEDFEKNCSVLVRLLLKTAVDDVSDVVRATNTQNPMRSRNLVSNSIEQIGFARIFAELGWFYAAKEGAWNAFDKDPKRWRPSLNKSSKEFKTHTGKIRSADNLELAQRWLSFIGCSATAAEERDQLFDNHYEIIFKKRTKQHGYHFDYNTSVVKSDENSEPNAPNASLMLVSHLCYYFLTSMVPSLKDNRIDALKRLGKDANKKLGVEDINRINYQELDGKLFGVDNTFALNRVLHYMPFLFTDFVGFVLYESLGQNIHNYGKEILSNYSFKTL